MKRTEQMFKMAEDIYAEQGVDVNIAMRKMKTIPLSIHAWQGDDVVGFESTDHALTGGCHVTGNYPGRARTAEEVRGDLDFALKNIGGVLRVNLQGHQVDRMFPGVDRDAFTIDNFSSWLDWAYDRNIGLDIAPAFYSHALLKDGLSLSHPDSAVRRFWINHAKAIRRIGADFGKKLGTPAVCNFWAPDGFKDTPADRYTPRKRLMMALDECFEEKISPKYVLDSLESKLFGIGVESNTVGSHEFCMAYAITRGKLICIDSGHFHPTESIADKLSAISCLASRFSCTSAVAFVGIAIT